MATLQQEQFDQIAAYINGQLAKWKAVADYEQSGGSTPIQNTGWKSLVYNEFVTKYIGPNGFQNAVDAGVSPLELLLLQTGLDKKKFSKQVADAYLATKYQAVYAKVANGTFQYTAGQYKAGPSGLLTKTSEAAAQADKNNAEEQAKNPDKSIGAFAAQQAASSGALAAPAPLEVLQLPEDYDHELVSAALADLASQTSGALASIAAGGLTIPPGSLSGSLIAPGSLPPTALDPIAFREQMLSFPAPDQAVLVYLAPDSSLDSQLTTTVGAKTYTGPGRVWRVQKIVPPFGWRASLGPTRYRLIFDQQTFGVFSARFPLAGALVTDGSAWEVTYGLLIRDLPILGTQRPHRILYADYSRDVPASSIGRNNAAPAWLTGANQLFEARATQNFLTAPPTLFTELADANLASGSYAWMSPTFEYSGGPASTGTYLTQIQGMLFNLLRGETAEQIYAEINSLASPDFSEITGSARPPEASVPGGMDSDGVLPACAVVKDGGSFRSRSSTSILGADAVYAGLPLRYDDADAVRASSSTFSVVARIWPPRSLSYAQQGGAGLNLRTTPSNDMRAATWAATGVKLQKSNNREIAVDIVIV